MIKSFLAAFKAPNGTVITVMAYSKSHFLQTFGKGNSSQVMFIMQLECCHLQQQKNLNHT